jgi:chromate transporter
VSNPRPSLSAVFLAFLRLGMTAFGGPAMVAYIRDVAVRQKGWVTEESFADGVALCQTLPGATALQAAAYAGLRAAGPAGAIVAFLAFALPAFVLMVALAAVYQQAQAIPSAVAAFRGLQGIVIALVSNAAVDFGRRTLTSRRDGLWAFIAAILLVAHISPVLVISGAATAGLALHGRNATRPSRPPSVPATGRAMTAAATALAAAAATVLAALFLLHRQLGELGALMVKVDLFAFGGGYASLPVMLHEVVEARGWLDARTFMDGIALGQVTPGPIVITATFVGYQVAGLAGALVATLAIFAPSLTLLIAAVPHFDRLQANRFVQRAVHGILASFVGLLVAVALRFALAAAWSLPLAAIAAAAFLALRLRVDVLWVVAVGGGLAALLL